MADNGRPKGESVLVAALAGGATVRDAAKTANVGERTVYRRLEDPAFQQEVTDARAELIGRTVGALVEASTEAVQTLRTLLGIGYPPAVRLRAARSVLELGTQLRESEELGKRIAALEQQQAMLPPQQLGGERWRA
jgi:hypothetical protein